MEQNIGMQISLLCELDIFFEDNTKGGRKFFTFGSGVKYNVFALDFSYLINASRAINGNNPLANTMRFTLVFDFGEMENLN